MEEYLSDGIYLRGTVRQQREPRRGIGAIDSQGMSKNVDYEFQLERQDGASAEYPISGTTRYAQPGYQYAADENRKMYRLYGPNRENYRFTDNPKKRSIRWGGTNNV